MIEELIKRLQERNLSEQEEENLLKEIEETKKIIVANQFARKVEQEKLKIVNQDKDKMKMLKLIDEEIDQRRKKNKSLEKTWNVIAIILTFFVVGTAIGNTILIAMTTMHLTLEVILVVLSLFVPIGVCVSISKILAKVLSKKEKINNREIAKLTKEKELIMDDVKVDFEKAVIDNIKLTKLPRISKIINSNNDIYEDNLTNSISD